MFRKLGSALLGLVAILFLSACGLQKTKLAAIWTDVPEIALYAELFNKSQGRYRVEVLWKENLARAVRETKKSPALVIGRFLKSSSVRDRFRSLDYLFGELTVDQSAFYPGLLALGNMEGRQLLLPVSFDIPAIVFLKEGEAILADDFLVSLEDLAAASKAYNKKQGAAFVRMGFSPRWDTDFLFLAINATGASFREGRPLAWSESGLREAVEGLRSWSASVNGKPSLEEDFQFKYLYTPAYTYLAEKRALFAHMNSAEFFLVPEEKRAVLDYRWFANSGSVPLTEDIVYAAIPRKGSESQAAEAFLKWFYREENQEALLESSRKTRSLEGSFGIAGGFSAIRAVNERIFPSYYPALLGHLPPADALSAPNVLPSDWPELKAEVVLPWLSELLGKEGDARSDYGAELNARLAERSKRSIGR